MYATELDCRLVVISVSTGNKKHALIQPLLFKANKTNRLKSRLDFVYLTQAPRLLSQLKHRATPWSNWFLMLTLQPQLDDWGIDHIWPASTSYEVPASALALQLCTNEKIQRTCLCHPVCEMSAAFVCVWAGAVRFPYCMWEAETANVLWLESTLPCWFQQCLMLVHQGSVFFPHIQVPTFTWAIRPCINYDMWCCVFFWRFVMINKEERCDVHEEKIGAKSQQENERFHFSCCSETQHFSLITLNINMLQQIINLLLQFLIAQLVPKKRITALAKRDCIRVSEALRESSTNTSEVFSSHRKFSRARQHWWHPSSLHKRKFTHSVHVKAHEHSYARSTGSYAQKREHEARCIVTENDKRKHPLFFAVTVVSKINIDECSQCSFTSQAAFRAS